MWIITEKTLREFTTRHPESTESLAIWTKLMKARRFADTMQLRSIFGSASFLSGGRVVFNVGGNNYRIVVNLKYVTPDHRVGRCYIRHVLTHAEYDRRTAEGSL